MVIHIPAGPADPCQNRCVGEAVWEGAAWGAAPRGSPRDGRNPNLPTPTRMHRTLQTPSPLSSLPYPVAWWMGTPPLHPRPCLHCCPPRGCRRGLDEAPESWQHRRGRLAPQGIACAGNAAPRRHYHSKVAKMSRKRLLTPGFVMPWSEPVFFLFRTFDARLFVELLAAGC